MADKITLEIEGAAVDALLAAPDGDGRVGGVVVTFHRTGLDIFTQWLVDDLAGHGFAAISPDHYHWLPEGTDLADRKAHLSDARLATDLKAACSYLEGLPGVDGERIAIIGHCMGGRTAYVGAATDARYKAACVWYSGGMFNAQGEGPSPFERIGDITCPVLGLYGNDDHNPTSDDVDKIDAALTAAEVEHVFHRYDDTGHAFMDFNNPDHYMETSAKDSWARALKYLNARIGAGAGVDAG